MLPQCRNLTVVELDARLIGFLRQNVPHANVLQGDALEIIQNASFDVLIGNLPHAVTDSLLKFLPSPVVPYSRHGRQRLSRPGPARPRILLVRGHPQHRR